MTYFTGSVCSIIKLIAHDDNWLFTNQYWLFTLLMKVSVDEIVWVSVLTKTSSGQQLQNHRHWVHSACCFIDRAHLIGTPATKRLLTTFVPSMDLKSYRWFGPDKARSKGESSWWRWLLSCGVNRRKMRQYAVEKGYTLNEHALVSALHRLWKKHTQHNYLYANVMSCHVMSYAVGEVRRPRCW